MYFAGFAITFASFRIFIWQQGGKNVYLEIAGIFVSMMFLVVLVCCRNQRRREVEREARESGRYRFIARYILGDDIYNRYYAPYLHTQRVGLTEQEIAMLPRINYEKRKAALLAAKQARVVGPPVCAHTFICDDSELRMREWEAQGDREGEREGERDQDDTERVSDAASLAEGEIGCVTREGESEKEREPDRSSLCNCCTICLVEYVPTDELVLLPCSHDYHEACIAKWLAKQASCPLCKYDVRQLFSVSLSPHMEAQTDSRTDAQSLSPSASGSLAQSDSVVQREGDLEEGLGDGERESEDEDADGAIVPVLETPRSVRYSNCSQYVRVRERESIASTNTGVSFEYLSLPPSTCPSPSLPPSRSVSLSSFTIDTPSRRESFAGVPPLSPPIRRERESAEELRPANMV